MNAEEALQLVQPTSPDEELEEKQTVETVNNMLETLSPKEDKVLRMRFGIGCAEHTLDEISEVFLVTRERIRQIESSALRKMKNPKRSDVLRGVMQ